MIWYLFFFLMYMYSQVILDLYFQATKNVVIVFNKFIIKKKQILFSCSMQIFTWTLVTNFYAFSS